jgi:uncharacterized repeat protein (TIGR01451 family)
VSGAAPADTSDLGVRATDGPDPVGVGSTLAYTVQVENLGPVAATGVGLAVTIPSSADFVSATATQGTCAHKGNTVRCELGSVAVAPGAGPTATVAVIPRRAGTISATASVDGVEKDSVTGNDRATATTTVTAPATCRGATVTVLGTPGDDTLAGTPGPDVVSALGGDDTISSLSGRDLVCAGRGSDRVFGGSAADRIYGGAGRDRLVGRGGPDLLRGGAAGDVLLGSAGADRLRGGAGSDRCRGGAGADSSRGCER